MFVGLLHTRNIIANSTCFFQPLFLVFLGSGSCLAPTQNFPLSRHRLISTHFDGMAVYGVYFSQNKAKVGLF